MRLPRSTILTSVLGVAALAALVAPLFDRSLIGLAPATLLVILIVTAMPRRGGWRPGLATAGAACGALLIPIAVAALITKALWGYVLWPPSPDRRILEARLVRTAAHARTQAYLSGDVAVTFERLGRSARAIAAAEGDAFQRPTARVLSALDRRKKLAEVPDRPKARSSMELFPLLERSGRLYAGEGEFVNAKDLRGFVIEAEGADGTPLVLLTARGGEASRDRHPFYEFLFKGSLDSGPLELLSTRRFLFDVGSLAGLGWRELFAAAATVELLLLAVAVLAARSRKVRPVAVVDAGAVDVAS